MTDLVFALSSLTTVNVVLIMLSYDELLDIGTYCTARNHEKLHDGYRTAHSTEAHGFGFASYYTEVRGVFLLFFFFFFKFVTVLMCLCFSIFFYSSKTSMSVQIGHLYL